MTGTMSFRRPDLQVRRNASIAQRALAPEASLSPVASRFAQVCYVGDLAPATYDPFIGLPLEMGCEHV